MLELFSLQATAVDRCEASQNDCLNLSFLKDTYGNAKKMARQGGKMVIYESQILRLTLYKTRLHTLLTKKLSPSKMTRKGFVHSVSF